MKSKSEFINHIDKKRAQKHVIPVRQAIAYTKKYREILRRNGERLKQIFDLPRAESFDRNAIELLLKQKGVESIRFYYGVDEKNQVKLLLVPVDKNGRDIFVPLLKTKRQDKPSGAMMEEDSTDEFEEEEDADEEEESEEQDKSEENSTAQSSEQNPSALGVEDAQVVNSGQRCPTACDDLSVLNDQE